MIHELFQIPLTRLRVFYVDDVAFSMGVCGPEELKYPQKLLHTYVKYINYLARYIRKSLMKNVGIRVGEMLIRLE
jgi:hypothetical protein